MKNKLVKLIPFIMTILFCSGAVFAEEISIVTVNAWPGLEDKGFFSCGEYEEDEVRGFRKEILLTGLKELDADVVVLNGINPADSFAADYAAALEMSYSSRVAGSGFRIGPVSLPVNLKLGDAVLTADALNSEPAGNLSINSLISTDLITFAGRNGVQVIGRKLTVPGISGEDGSAFTVYFFSAVWSESVFNDKESLDRLMNAYLSGDLSAERYPQLIEEAVAGAEARFEQAEKTLSFINSVAGASPVILAGSLNALPGSRELQVLKNAGFIDVYERAGSGPGYTVDSGRNTNFEKVGEEESAVYKYMKDRYRADYILIRGDSLEPLTAGVVLDDPVYGVYPSNRFGVRAVIKIDFQN